MIVLTRHVGPVSPPGEGLCQTVCPTRQAHRRGVILAKKSLIIGINRYQNSGNDLRGCVNDVKSMLATLKKMAASNRPT